MMCPSHWFRIPHSARIMLPYDVVTQILDFAADDYGLLFQCSLVTWEFNCAASQLLYFHVVVSPPFREVLNLRDTGSIPVRLIWY